MNRFELNHSKTELEALILKLKSRTTILVNIFTPLGDETSIHVHKYKNLGKQYVELDLYRTDHDFSGGGIELLTSLGYRCGKRTISTTVKNHDFADAIIQLSGVISCLDQQHFKVVKP